MHAHRTDITETARKAVRRERETQCLTRDELALQAEISASLLAKLENGDRGISLNMLGILAYALDKPPAFFLDNQQHLTEPGLVQPIDKASLEQETREEEDWTPIDPSRVSELHEQLEEIADLLHAIDKVGDGIGGADGYAVSAVALSAKSVADNALQSLKVIEASRGSRACACAREGA